MKAALVFALLGTLAFAGTASAQKTFERPPGNDEGVRLDPANYHTGKTYTGGGGIQVDIESQQPVTIFLTGEGEWNHAQQYPEALGTLRMLCLREHVVKTRYVCDLPVESMTLVIRDDRGTHPAAASAGLGEVLNSEPAAIKTPAGNAVGSTVGVGVGLATIL